MAKFSVLDTEIINEAIKYLDKKRLIEEAKKEASVIEAFDSLSKAKENLKNAEKESISFSADEDEREILLALEAEEIKKQEEVDKAASCYKEKLKRAYKRIRKKEIQKNYDAIVASRKEVK